MKFVLIIQIRFQEEQPFRFKINGYSVLEKTVTVLVP